MQKKTAGRTVRFTLQEYARLRLHYQQAGYALPRWVVFCAHFMDLKFKVRYYDSRTTVSKYVFVSRGGRSYKVRFSNHKPARWREQDRDCDFFVGVTNFGVTRTEEAIRATLAFFGMPDKVVSKTP